MGLFDTPTTDLLPGLLPCHWRGVRFHAPDATHEVGRRAIVTYFPGLDDPAIEDLGRGDGLVRIRGLIVGDDYVARALALQSALHAPGPGTFLHPWLGEMTAIVPQGGGLIQFSEVELRVVRFDVVFQPLRPFGAFGGRFQVAGGSSLSVLLGSVSAVLWAARSFGVLVLGGSGLGAASWAAACETADAIGSLVEATCAASPAAAALEPVLAAPLAAITSAITQGAGQVAAAAIVTALVDLTLPVAESAIGGAPSAIGPGVAVSLQTLTPSERSGWSVADTGAAASSGSVVVSASTSAAPAVDPLAARTSAYWGARAGAALLLQLAEDVGPLDAHGAAAMAVRLAARVAMTAHAVRTATEIAFESRQDAAAWRDALDAALATLADDVAEMATTVDAAATSALWGAVADLQGALARDMSEVIGRLKPVRIYAPAVPVSAWLLAQHFAGDDPAEVVSMLDDIVRRNRLAHPALAQGAVEVLTQ